MSHACVNTSLNTQETDFVQELAPMSPEEREYDAWFRAKVQEALDEGEDGGVSLDVALEEMQKIIDEYK